MKEQFVSDRGNFIPFLRFCLVGPIACPTTSDISRNIIGCNENHEPGNSCLLCVNTFRQGSSLSRALNMLAGGNAIAGLDDYINNVVPAGLGESGLLKLVTIPTAIGMTVPALFDRVPVHRPRGLLMH